MKLLEQYEELVERRPTEMSYAWKGSLIVAYFLSSISSYACAFLFFTFWNDVCGGHCLFWAEVESQAKVSSSVAVDSLWRSDKNVTYDWTQDVLVIYQFHKHCQWFHFACLLSCVVAITFLMMVTICGRGGHDASLFVAPWRIVLPALVCSLIMIIVTTTASHEFTYGCIHFSNNLYELAKRVMNTTNNLYRFEQPCEAFQTFTKIYNIYGFDSCGIYKMIQITSWAMSWGWIGSFCVLSFRILTAADFKLLKVRIYELPEDGPEREEVLEKLQQGQASAHVQITL